MRSPWLRGLALLLLVVQSAACMRWTPVPTPVGLRMMEEERVAKVRLVTTDGRTFHTVRPVAANDSLVFDNGAGRLAYGDVAGVALGETDQLKSVALVIAVPLLLLGLALGQADCCGSY